MPRDRMGRDDGMGSGESKRPRILLVSFYNVIGLGVRTLHAVLQQRGHDVRSVYFQYQKPREHFWMRSTDAALAPLMQVIEREKPDVVGLNVFTYLEPIARDVTRAIRDRFGLPVIWGGIHPTLEPATCLEHADVICVGDGEVAVPGLLDRMAQGQALTDPAIVEGLPNLVSAGGRDRLASLKRERTEDLDALPYMSFTDDGVVYIKGNEIHERWPFAVDLCQTRLHTSSSRGCPYSCSYCYAHLEHEYFRGLPAVRRRSVDHLMGELLEARRRNPDLDYIFFWDDVFFLDSQWLSAFCERYRKEIGLPFFTYGHPNTIRAESLDMAIDAGLKDVGMGIQAGPTLSRTVFDRPYRVERLVEAAELLHARGIEPTYDVIQGNPLASDADHAELIDILLKLPKPFILNTHDLHLFPHYRITEMAKKAGIRVQGSPSGVQKFHYMWDGFLDPRRDRRQLAWDGLYYLCGRRRVPSRIVRTLKDSPAYHRYARAATLPLYLYDRTSQLVAGLLPSTS